MSFSRTCKMLGIVLDKEVAPKSFRAIKEKLERFPHGFPGEIRPGETDRSFRLDLGDMIQSLLVKEPGDFFVTGVELINENQLQFDVTWLLALSDEAINQLYIVPVYLGTDSERELIAFHAKID